MLLQTYWLTDGEEIFHSANFSADELEDQQKECDDLTAGTFWWVHSFVEPDLPRSPMFRHLSREGMAG